jgi:hypothetical protein
LPFTKANFFQDQNGIFWFLIGTNEQFRLGTSFFFSVWVQHKTV